eukprot:TRINITY_DN29942_c0_g1_i2.p1 TRINITY_DN29942_c0_g1~~TRINITY_DN29942_c0_g1_i2.p1  ORF type:complete len:114 (+),score=18.98 TRINITY_DN29942_c0_g1_i2:71-412(+)
MGLLQLALDAWLGTTAYAFCRRAGIFASPRLELVPNERVRFLLSRYLQFGETSASKIESATEGVQAAANQMRSTSGSPGSVTPSQAVRKISVQAEKALTSAESLLRRLRQRLR